MNYELRYRQPYEYDEDSPEGIGDHSILLASDTLQFVAENDEAARKIADEFLSKGSIIFNHLTDGDGKTYLREFVELTGFHTVQGSLTRRLL